jgi:hypothetical protein
VGNLKVTNRDLKNRTWSPPEVEARKLLSSHEDLSRELEALRKSLATLDADTRRQFDIVYEAILDLMNPIARGQ